MIPVTDEDEEDDEVPGRSWLRLAMGVGASILLLLAIVFAFNLGRGRTPLGELPEEERSPSSSSTTAAELTEVADLTAADFDPQGDPPEENSDLAPLAVDGDPATTWRTVTYDQDLGPGGLKTGVGLTLDLGGVRDVAEVELTLVGTPTSASLYVTDQAPAGVQDLTAAAESELSRTRQTVTLDEPVSGRFLTVWLTSLPELAEGGFRGEVAEVVVRE